MGRVLGGDRTADAQLLALPDQLDRAAPDVDSADRGERRPGGPTGLRPERLRLAPACLRGARAARAHERALVHNARPRRTLACDAVRQPATVHRCPLRSLAALGVAERPP